MGPKGLPDTKTDRPTDRRSKHQLKKKSISTRVQRATVSLLRVMQSIALHVISLSSESVLTQSSPL
jgi:hypothetical protein